MALVETDLAERVRSALSGNTTREKRMFGGLAFMVNEKMVVHVRTGGSLLVRVDPQRNDELIARDGASQAEMGAGRTMGPGWISVAGAAIGTDEQLAFWLSAAMAHNAGN